MSLGYWRFISIGFFSGAYATTRWHTTHCDWWRKYGWWYEDSCLDGLTSCSSLCRHYVLVKWWGMSQCYYYICCSNRNLVVVYRVVCDLPSDRIVHRVCFYTCSSEDVPACTDDQLSYNHCGQFCGILFEISLPFIIVVCMAYCTTLTSTNFSSSDLWNFRQD